MPNGSYVYVVNGYDSIVSVIQTSDSTVIDTISVGDSPIGIAIMHNGSYVYVANHWDDMVSVVGF